MTDLKKDPVRGLFSKERKIIPHSPFFWTVKRVDCFIEQVVMGLAAKAGNERM